MEVNRNHRIGGIVVLAFLLAAVVSASSPTTNCADDQDGTCTLNVAGIIADVGQFLNGYVESGYIYGKSAVHAGASDQTRLDGDGLFTSSGEANVHDVVTVNLTATGSKSFRIDHPLDPENKILTHWSVESNELKNIYDGVVTLGSDGGAVVEMPNWFDGLNREFRYQLTPIGGPAAGLYIAEELTVRRFTIAGGKPHLKVSWQVTGVRHDPSARQIGWKVEENKEPAHRGKYMDPSAYGKPESMGIRHLSMTESTGRKRLEIAR